MKCFVSAFFAAICLFLAGCQEKDAAPPTAAGPLASPNATPPRNPNAAAAKYSPYPTKPQPKLQTVKLWLGTNEISAELALTPKQVETGMMWRTNMGEMEGMLFVFSGPHRTGFWMKNTLLPLSCAYIDPEGVIKEIHPMEPQNTNAITASSDDIQYVLEMNRDWFMRHSVTTGAVVRTQFGSLAETFMRR